MKKWKIISSNYIFQNPFHSVRKESCELPNGLIIKEYYVNEYPEWANAFVLTKDQKVIFVKQYRHGARDFFVEVPAGKVEQNEDFSLAIKREVEEETGYTSQEEPILLGELVVNPANQTNKIHTYLIKDAELTHSQHLDDTEEIEIVEMPLTEVIEMVNKGQINHLFTCNAVLLALHYLNNNK